MTVCQGFCTKHHLKDYIEDQRVFSSEVLAQRLLQSSCSYCELDMDWISMHG